MLSAAGPTRRTLRRRRAEPDEGRSQISELAALCQTATARVRTGVPRRSRPATFLDETRLFAPGTSLANSRAVNHLTRTAGRLLVVSVAFAALACGGKVSGGGGSSGTGGSAGTGPTGNTGSGNSGSSGSVSTPGTGTGSNGSGSSGSSGSCTQGASCSEDEACGGGGDGCSFSCSCVNGSLECSGTPCPSGPPACPVYQPYPGTSCSVADQECGYTSDSNPCGAVNCYCEEGLWNCEPTCVALDAGTTSVADAGAD